MKKIDLFAFLILLLPSLNGQNKILGFGKLKLGMKVTEIDEIKDAQQLSDLRIYHTHIRSSYRVPSYELMADTNNLGNNIGFLNKDVRIFTVNEVQITEQIKINQVELIFFRDSLVSISCGYDLTGWSKNVYLREALSIKYGNPLEEKYNGTSRTLWNSGDPSIVCEEYLREFKINYEWHYIYYLKLENSYKMKLIQEKEDIRRKIIDEKRKKILISNF